MIAEVILSPEALVTQLALVRPFVGVRALVDQQVVRLGEVTPAVATNELLATARARCAAMMWCRRCDVSTHLLLVVKAMMLQW